MGHTELKLTKQTGILYGNTFEAVYSLKEYIPLAYITSSIWKTQIEKRSTESNNRDFWNGMRQR